MEKLKELLLKQYTSNITIEQLIKMAKPFNLTLEEKKEIKIFLINNGIEIIDYNTTIKEEKIESMDSLNLLLKEFNDTYILKPDEEKELFITLKNNPNDKDIINKIIEHNLRLVVDITKRYQGYSTIDKMDLIQEGVIGLRKAIDKFDIDKGFKFSTYATVWIRQGMTRFIGNQARTLRLPIHLIEDISVLRRIIAKLTVELEKNPTVEELVEYSDFDEKHIKLLLENMYDLRSLNSIVDAESKIATELQDTVVDNYSECEYEKVYNKIIIDELLTGLKKRDVEIITRRYGLDENKEHYNYEIAKIYGISTQRANQIEIKVINHARKRMRFLHNDKIN